VPDEISDEESLRRLREFLRDVQRLLGQITDRPRRVIPRRHHDRMAAAWESLSPKFESVLTALSPASTANVVPTLRLRGLMGAELVFKLEVFADARDRYLDHGTPKKGRGRGRRWWARWFALLTPTLHAADAVLVGLSAVFPGVEAIREFKDALEAGMALRRDLK
jgi:hypothetical protein